MALEINKIAETLFDKIRSRFENVTVTDENSETTLEPDKGRFFSFAFVANGKNYGSVTISLIDEKNLKIYYDKSMTSDNDPKGKQIWYDFLKDLRLFAKRNMLSFDVRDIAKSGLELRDQTHATADVQSYAPEELQVSESKLGPVTGTRRSSYQKLESVKIIARHSKPIDEEQRGARSRNIHSLFIETGLGERFRLPEGTTLNGARAYARHIKNGGAINDDLGQHISKIIKEMSDLKHFVRNMRGRKFEDAETTSMVEAAIDHYGGLHRDLFGIKSQRGYEQYRDNWSPDHMINDDYDADELKERFVKRIFDDRMLGALPIVYRAYKSRKDLVGEEFESWANGVLETNQSDNLPFANSVDSDPNELDGETQDDTIKDLFDSNEFHYQFSDGKYWFQSHEELERAKDILAEYDPNLEFPDMGVHNVEYGNSNTTDWDQERSDSDMDSFKRLAGITK